MFGRNNIVQFCFYTSSTLIQKIEYSCHIYVCVCFCVTVGYFFERRLLYILVLLGDVLFRSFVAIDARFQPIVRFVGVCCFSLFNITIGALAISPV